MTIVIPKTDLPRVPRLLLVVESTHPISTCEGCAKAAQGAEIHARVMGSVECRYNDIDAATGVTHSARVASKRGA